MPEYEDINAALKAIWSQPLPWHEGYVETPRTPLRAMWDERDVVALAEACADLEESHEDVVRWRAARDQYDEWMAARIEAVKAGFSPSELPPWQGY